MHERRHERSFVRGRSVARGFSDGDSEEGSEDQCKHDRRKSNEHVTATRGGWYGVGARKGTTWGLSKGCREVFWKGTERLQVGREVPRRHASPLGRWRHQGRARRLRRWMQRERDGAKGQRHLGARCSDNGMRCCGAECDRTAATRSCMAWLRSPVVVGVPPRTKGGPRDSANGCEGSTSCPTRSRA
jgi:hypothetical protein